MTLVNTQRGLLQKSQGNRIKMIRNWLIALTIFQCLLVISAASAQDYANADIESEVNRTYSFLKTNNGEFLFRKVPLVDEVGIKSNYSVSTLHRILNSTEPTSRIIGDSFVQERLIRSQVYFHSGRHLLTKAYDSEAKQIDALYENAIALSQKPGFNKSIGDRLLRSDIETHGLDVIWPELRRVNNVLVLVPILHIVNDHQVTGHEVSFSGEQVIFRNVNIRSGSITTRRNALLSTAGNVSVAEGARIVGDGNLNMNIGGTLLNTGSLTATETISITASNFYQKTLVHRFQSEHGISDRLGIVSNIKAGDGIYINSMSDITFLGAEAQSGEDIVFNAEGNIKVGTVTLARESSYTSRTSQYQMSAIEHVQSSISARDNIQLMASGLITIDASKLHSEQGHIEILADLGVTIVDELNQRQTVSHRKFGKMTEDESAYVTVAMRSVLDAGRGIVIHSEKGDITLKATDISSEEGTSVNATSGAINLLMAIENDQYSYSSVKERLFTITNVSRGHNYENAVPNTIVGDFHTEALYGVNVVFEGDPELSLQAQVESMAQMDGMTWLLDVWNTTDPSNYEAMELAYQEWNKKSTSLSPAAIAVISMVAAMAVGPTALEIGKATAAATVGTGSAAAGTVTASVTAGVTSFTGQAAVAAGNGAVNGNFSEAMEDFITADETWTSVATSMVSAAAISYVDSEFFTNNVTDSDVQTYAQNNNLGTLTPGSSQYIQVQDKLTQLTFGQQAAQAVTHASVNAGIDAIVYGEGIDEFTDAFITNLGQNSINLIGKKLANKIGDAAKNPNPDVRINEATKYIAHAALGCALGGAQSLNENSGDSEFSCVSGAGGAIIGELVATQIRKDFFNDAGELRKDKEVSIVELEAMYNDYQTHGVNMARLTAGLTAFALEGDVGIATGTAGNSAENNAFWFLVIPAFIALEKAYTVYEWVVWSNELGEALQADDQQRATELLQEKAVDLGVDAAATLVPGGKTLKEISEYLRKKFPGNPEIADDLANYADNIDAGTANNIAPNSHSSSIIEPKLEHHVGPRTPIRASKHTLQSQRDTIEAVKKGDIDLNTNGNQIRKGNYGEMVTDETMVNKGFTPLHERISDIDQKITQGIDGLFEKNGKYYVVESKFGCSQLSKCLVDGSNQMDRQWILDRIQDMDLPETVKREIIVNRNYVPVVSQIGKEGSVVFKRLEANGSIMRGKKAKIPEIG